MAVVEYFGEKTFIHLNSLENLQIIRVNYNEEVVN